MMGLTSTKEQPTFAQKKLLLTQEEIKPDKKQKSPDHTELLKDGPIKLREWKTFHFR